MFTVGSCFSQYRLCIKTYLNVMSLWLVSLTGTCKAGFRLRNTLRSEMSLMPLNHMVCIYSAREKCPYFSCWQGWRVCFPFGKGFAIFLKTLDQIMVVKFVGHRALVICLVLVSSRGWWCLWPIQLSHTEEPGAVFRTFCWLLLLAQSDGFDLSLMCVLQTEVRARKMTQTIWVLFLVGYIFLH